MMAQMILYNPVLVVKLNSINFQKELQALRTDFPEAKVLYLFERIICMVLGVYLENTMKLEQFILYNNNHCRQLVASFNLTLTLCGREMEAVMSREKPRAKPDLN